MSNLSDKELDRLSREAAEQYEPDEDISSWEKLEQQLSREIEDQPPATPTRFRARPIGYGALLLLLVGASYFLLKTGNDSKSSTLKNKVSTEAKQAAGNNQDKAVPSNEEAINAGSAANKDGSVVEPKAANAGSNPTTPSTTANGSVKPSSQATDNKNNVASTDDKKIANEIKGGLTDQNASGNIGKKNGSTTKPVGKLTGAAIGASVVAANKNNTNKTGTKNKNSKNLAENGNDVADANNSPTLSSENQNVSGKSVVVTDQTDKPKYATLPELAFSNNSVIYISDSSIAKVTANSTDNPAPKKNQALHVNRSLKIGLMVGPDITLVHSTSGGRFSTNVGLTLGYQFAKRLSVNTGLIYTKKNYASEGKSFHPDWPSNVTDKIEYVTGDCSMWEIPLSLRYDFPMGNKITFFVNGGLSSYLMKNESYEIYYHGWGASSGYVQPWSKPNSDKYWFSVANISAGIEHQFSKNFSIQAEPFVKIPFSGIGLGNLQLNSYGVSFSLRYAPLLSKSRR